MRSYGSESDADRPNQVLRRIAARHVQAGSTGSSGAWATPLPMDCYSYLLILCESNSRLSQLLDGLYSTRTTLFLLGCQGNLRWVRPLISTSPIYPKLTNLLVLAWDDLFYADGEACTCDVTTLAMHQRVPRTS